MNAIESITSLQVFLNKYKAFKQGISLETAQQDKDVYLNLFKRFEPLNREANLVHQQEAVDYNIFEILKIQRKEVITHTPFLTNLINPIGSHSQGPLFYNSFLLHSLKKTASNFLNINPLHIRVLDEWDGSSYGRMDVFVHHLSHTNPFAWIIENKIGATDQKEQLSRYYKYLKNYLKLEDKNIRLFYLTSYGTDATSTSIDKALLNRLKDQGILINLSYQKDIAAWLENTLDEIRAANVNSVVKQYIKTIKQICK